MAVSPTNSPAAVRALSSGRMQPHLLPQLLFTAAAALQQARALRPGVAIPRGSHAAVAGVAGAAGPGLPSSADCRCELLVRGAAPLRSPSDDWAAAARTTSSSGWTTSPSPLPSPLVRGVRTRRGDNLAHLRAASCVGACPYSQPVQQQYTEPSPAYSQTRRRPRLCSATSSATLPVRTRQRPRRYVPSALP